MQLPAMVNATAELHAFLLAWLNGVAGRVLNPARPLLLGGGINDMAAIRHYAALAGLPAPGWSRTTRRVDFDSPVSPTHDVIVLDGRGFGPIIPADLPGGCGRLAAYLGTPLLDRVLAERSREVGVSPRNGEGRLRTRRCRPLAAALARTVAA